jgi:tartrate-resistant acid phosphatase type 5
MKFLLAVLFFVIFYAEASLNFISLGDWGSRGTDQNSVASEMDKIASKTNVSFVLSLGDNFYEDGVSSDTDPQWHSTYSKVYSMQSLQVPWYSILGNHDYHQNADAQIDFYNNKRDNRWYMPGHYYTKTFTQADFSVQIVFIDTAWFAPNESKRTHISNQPAKYKEQLNWLKQQLSSSKATYLIVAGHYPVFSVGEHGDCADNANAVQSLLEQYKVDAYLSGHDHTLQHLSNNGVEFFVSGNGSKRGKVGSQQDTSADSLNFAKVDPGFMVHEIDAQQLVTRVIDHNGVELYTYTIKPKRSNDLPSNIQ